MKKLSTLLIALAASTSLWATEGALSGRFTINESGDQIVFSRGNLQYVGTWQFAEHQWDYFGNSQSDNHRDLFGWGTGDAPNKCDKEADYYIYNNWGANPITNGGNVANAWRTLTKDEWIYLLISRTSANILYAVGTVNVVNGVIFLPDDWTTPDGLTCNPANMKPDGGTGYWDMSSHASDNTYTAEQWAAMESAGAVFFPFAGRRYQTTLFSVGANGHYWSSTIETAVKAWFLRVSDLIIDTESDNRYMGYSVRLVQAVSNGDPTAIDETDAKTKAVKHIVDGQLFIEKNSKTYNAIGVEVK